MEMSGATALVTGGAVRLGRAIALELAAAGARVAITHRSSPAEADRTVSELRAHGVDALAVTLEVKDPKACSTAVAEVTEGLGPVDVLVNNVSAFALTPFPTDDHEAWHETFDVILHGAYYLTNAVAPSMLERERGTVVNIVDLSAWQPWPDRGAHSVAKAALLALTRQLAVELAPAVTANAVAPGPTIPNVGFDDVQVDRLARRTLRGEWVDPAQVAAAVRFLAESDSVTGECITVDCGESWGHVRSRFSDHP